MVDNLHSNHHSEESRNKSIKVEPNDISTHNMMHNIIQELKCSSRIKFKQSGANTASDFVDELAVVTGKKHLALSDSNDFASSLAKCVAEKEHCITPKKSGRKVLMLVHASPSPQSADTCYSEFLSDYWWIFINYIYKIILHTINIIIHSQHNADRAFHLDLKCTFEQVMTTTMLNFDH